MAPFALALAVTIAAAGADSAALIYEKRAAQARASVPDVQFAILHALVGWKGGVNPPYASYELRDRLFLGSLGIKVSPLQDAERAVLDSELAEIRRLHNYGIAGVDNGRRPITFDEVVARHRALIVRNGSRIAYVEPDGTPVPQPTAEDLWDRQMERLLAMKADLDLMRGSATSEDFARGFERFAAQAGSAHALRYERGAPRQPAYEACLKAFAVERAKAERLEPSFKVKL